MLACRGVLRLQQIFPRSIAQAESRKLHTPSKRELATRPTPTARSLSITRRARRAAALPCQPRRRKNRQPSHVHRRKQQLVPAHAATAVVGAGSDSPRGMERRGAGRPPRRDAQVAPIGEWASISLKRKSLNRKKTFLASISLKPSLHVRHASAMGRLPLMLSLHARTNSAMGRLPVSVRRDPSQRHTAYGRSVPHTHAL